MGEMCDFPESESRHRSSNGKHSEFKLGLVRGVPRGFSWGRVFEILSTEPAGLVGNPECSPAGLEAVHTWETCTPEIYILKKYLCKIH